MEYLQLSNGVSIPTQMMGTSICDMKGKKAELFALLERALIYAAQTDTVGFDTARDYANEPLLGKIFSKMYRNKIMRRENVFITTKVGNGQQRLRNMKHEIDLSLKALKTDYIDLWLLHWPLPDYWLDNWSQMQDIYKSGKVRAIGIANCRERHIEMLKQAHLPMPHVIQIEYHPFRTVPSFVALCRKEKIQLEAYSANCLMLPFVKENPTLNELAAKYHKTVTQIIMCWHVQQGVIPIFRSFNPAHISENVDIHKFTLTDEDMQRIFALDRDYKFHPESLNCPGY